MTSYTSFEIQTRSEVTGLKFFQTIKEAFDHAEKDKSVWKIIFGDDIYTSGKARHRFVKEGDAWKNEPLIWVSEPPFVKYNYKSPPPRLLTYMKSIGVKLYEPTWKVVLTEFSTVIGEGATKTIAMQQALAWFNEHPSASGPFEIVEPK